MRSGSMRNRQLSTDSTKQQYKTSTKPILTTESASEQGTLSQPKVGDKDLGNKDTREKRNDQQGQRTGRNDSDTIGSDSSSYSRSSRSLSVRSILWLQNNNQRGQHTKFIEEKQWGSTTCRSILPRQQKLSKQLKRIQIEAPKNIDSSKNDASMQSSLKKNSGDRPLVDQSYQGSRSYRNNSRGSRLKHLRIQTVPNKIEGFTIFT